MNRPHLFLFPVPIEGRASGWDPVEPGVIYLLSRAAPGGGKG